ncbi:MAG: hypothetical protein R3D59_10865 [Paracoccaceae bacterium]
MLRAEDIIFGHWDGEAEKFEPDEYAFDAVMVSTARAQERTNSVGTYLLKFAGVDALDIRRISVFETYRPTCLEEGIVGEEEVVVQSGNYFAEGFCVHSNDHATLSSGNTCRAHHHLDAGPPRHRHSVERDGVKRRARRGPARRLLPAGHRRANRRDHRRRAQDPDLAYYLRTTRQPDRDFSCSERQVDNDSARGISTRSTATPRPRRPRSMPAPS